MPASVKLSTGAKKEMIRSGILRAFNDTVLNIYSGVPPASADDAVSGTLLAQLTIDGSSYTPAIAREDFFTVTSIGSNGDTITVTITPAIGSSETFVFTKTSAQTTTDDIVRAIVNLLQDSNIIDSMASTETTESAVIMRAKYAGDSYNISVTATGGITVSPSGTLTPVIANVRGTGLKFEPVSMVSSGILEKVASDIWRGSVLQNGTAQWFRIQRYDDSGGSSTDAVRLQGTCSTSTDGVLQLTGSLSLVSGTTITVSSFYVKVNG